MLNLTPTPVKLLNHRAEGENAIHFSFSLPNPGAIPDPQPGQFFTLYVPGVGSTSFFFTQPPDESGIFRTLGHRKNPVARALASRQRGGILGVLGPFGNAWELNKLRGQTVLIIADGCSLAPLASLIDYLIEQRCCRQLALCHRSRSIAAQTFNMEKRHWHKNIAIFNIIQDSDTWDLTGTLLNPLVHVLDQLGVMPTALLLSGPEVMMHTLAVEFIHRHLSPQMIWLATQRSMGCAVGLCGHCYPGHHHIRIDRWAALQRLFSARARAGS